MWTNTDTKAGHVEVRTLQMDSRIVWEYNYGKDLMDMCTKTYNNVNTNTLSAEDLVTYNEDKAFLVVYENIFYEKGIFDLNWIFNASLSWDIPYFKKDKTTLTLYCQNILDRNNNKRYVVSVNDLPVISWEEEPRAFGLKLSIGF